MRISKINHVIVKMPQMVKLLEPPKQRVVLELDYTGVLKILNKLPEIML